MSFVSRVRSTVKSNSDNSSDDKEKDTNIQERSQHGLPSPAPAQPSHLPQIRVSCVVPELDSAELDAAGARALFEPCGSIMMARIIGVNKDFCSLFGLEAGQLAAGTFRLLQGPLTNTKHLQETWSEVRKGTDRCACPHQHV